MPPASQLPAKGNLFADLPPDSGAEIFHPVFANPACRIERIASFGHASPPDFWYEQDEDEWVVLLAGTACLCFADGGRAELQAGDWITLPAGRRHRVEAVSEDALWLAVHCRTTAP